MSLSNGLMKTVPSGWQIARLDDLKATKRYSFVGGPFGSNLTRSDYIDEPGVPVIRGTNLGGDTCQFIDDNFVYVTDQKADSLNQNLAYPGDLVFTQRGTLGQVVEIPKTARYERYVVSQSQMKLTVDAEKAISRYVYQFFRSPLATNYLNQRIQATGVPHINLGILKEFPVLLPPIQQQHRIAAILDKADAIRRKRAEGIRLSEELLRSTFLEMFGDPSTNSKQWPICQMEYLVNETQYGTSKKANGNEIGIPVLRMNNITYGGCIDLTDMKWCEINKAEIPQYTVQKGDLLFNRTNSPELVGKTAVWDREEAYAFAGYLFRVRFDESKVVADYISAFLNSAYGKRMLFDRSKPSNNMSNLSASEFRRFEVPLPDLSLQKKFNQAVHEIRALQERRSEGLAVSISLSSALVQLAFRGQL